ncbi:radical SAM/SPASM domain-containing protein [Prochlorococcus marinus]|uniref:radical SAM/SPASM domain-containing protein n=1 Tax=Prochlorococcus marinus TaxID=1219 RepID=UPI0022B54290|nr:radical SAM/SPASM domain-containing protein [Prochlorococcus marinus]
MEKTLLENLQRKRPIIDCVDLTENGPKPSFIDLNTGEYCNRKCVFCPRFDSSQYPNQHLYMKIDLAKKISKDLKSLGFNGIINICGYGEPLAHPEICDIVAILSDAAHVEIVTNGDLLKLDLIKGLYKAGISQLVISAYDGAHQIPKFEKLMNESDIPNSLFNIRKRWYSKEEGYGIKLTNRAGFLNNDNELIDQSRSCAYPHYSLTIDWNGDVLLCVQDWYKKLKFGNIFADSIEDIWFSKRMNQYRKNLIKGRKCAGFPCENCDADGLVFGKSHLEAWTKYINN